VATLAKESHLSERQVRYSLRRLEDLGELQTQIKGGPYGTNTYSLPLMVGAKIAPLGAVYDTWRGNLRHLEGQWIAPNPSLTIPKDKAALILQCVEESERTGEDADAIYARLRS
jgi:hypothetical protein